MAEHRIKHFARRRHDDEPVWLSPVPDGVIYTDVLEGIEKRGLMVIVCEVDDIPVYRDLNERWTHWDPEADPAAPEGQQELEQRY